jgi:hypothetical protein
MAARNYQVTSIEVLPKLDAHDNVVIKLNFTYGNAEASLQGSCSLPTPQGSLVPLESVSKELALEWLLGNCPNTAEEFDANLDAQIAKAANTPFVYVWTEAS